MLTANEYEKNLHTNLRIFFLIVCIVMQSQHHGQGVEF